MMNLNSSSKKYYKYYCFYYVWVRASQVSKFVTNVFFIFILNTLDYIKEMLEDLWDTRRNFRKIPSRKTIKNKLIESGIEL